VTFQNSEFWGVTRLPLLKESRLEIHRAEKKRDQGTRVNARFEQMNDVLVSLPRAS
jgi:hypothetical protein